MRDDQRDDDILVARRRPGLTPAPVRRSVVRDDDLVLRRRPRADEALEERWK